MKYFKVVLGVEEWIITEDGRQIETVRGHTPWVASTVEVGSNYQMSRS